MTDTAPQNPLAERALTRLRKLASGNGMEPIAISPIEIQEQVFVLEGRIEVSPFCESVSANYPGPIRGKDKQTARDMEALQREVARHKRSFNENPNWVTAVTNEIKDHESRGWGLEDAKVMLPEHSASYAVSETCPSCGGRKMLTCVQCQGQGTVICTQCQGQGREVCYHCAGRGEDPQQPQQKCPICQGTRYAPCRFCQTRGRLPCPTCQGNRGTPCSTCEATGRLTYEVTVSCGAKTHFKLIAGDLPSGLRRGLERIGVANIGKGHADIAVTRPSLEEEEAHEEGQAIPVLSYRAALPYAEMRMNFGKRKAVISVVGKRCVILGAPNFLDDALQPWRDKLKAAGTGNAAMEPALEARAMREILALAVSGNGNPEAIRKIYPFGLSTEAANEILTNMRLSINKVTLKTRSGIAAACGIGCAALFYLLLGTGWHAEAMRGWNLWAGAAIDGGLLCSALLASWSVLNLATRYVLKRRFPHLPVALTQKIGKTGYSMLGGIFIAFIACLLLAPAKPLWLSMIMR